MAKINNSHNFDAKDKFNLSSAIALEKVDGKEIEVTGCAIGTDVVEDKETNTGYIKCSDGTILCTISKTAIRSIDALIEVLADGEGKVKIRVDKRTSNGGRQFIVLTMV